jgi:hypothetical protein
MMKPASTLTLLALLAAAPAFAQARFQTGNLAWTPTLTLRDAGVDTNIYDEPTDPKRDHIAVVVPQADGVLTLGIAKVNIAGAAEFVYFQRYTNERSINKRIGVRVEVPFSRIRPLGGVSYNDARERQNSEIDLRARRTDRDVTVGLGFELTPRGSFEVSARAADSRYRGDEVFHGVQLARRFNRDTTGVSTRFRYDLSPLTMFTVEADASRDDFVLSPEYNADNFRVQGGFFFAPDAVLKGRALIGDHRLDPTGALAFGYDGLTASVDIGYVLLGRTRFGGSFLRDTGNSLEPQPYFLQTLVGAEVLHNLFGPVDVVGRASRERLDYPGIPERQLAESRLDVYRYGGGVAVRAAERFTMSVNFEFTERIGTQFVNRDYERRRLYTTVTYGF